MSDDFRGAVHHVCMQFAQNALNFQQIFMMKLNASASTCSHYRGNTTVTAVLWQPQTCL